MNSWSQLVNMRNKIVTFIFACYVTFVFAYFMIFLATYLVSILLAAKSSKKFLTPQNIHHCLSDHEYSFSQTMVPTTNKCVISGPRTVPSKKEKSGRETKRNGKCKSNIG